MKALVKAISGEEITPVLRKSPSNEVSTGAMQRKGFRSRGKAVPFVRLDDDEQTAVGAAIESRDAEPGGSRNQDKLKDSIDERDPIGYPSFEEKAAKTIVSQRDDSLCSTRTGEHSEKRISQNDDDSVYTGPQQASHTGPSLSSSQSWFSVGPYASSWAKLLGHSNQRVQSIKATRSRQRRRAKGVHYETLIEDPEKLSSPSPPGSIETDAAAIVLDLQITETQSSLQSRKSLRQSIKATQLSMDGDSSDDNVSEDSSTNFNGQRGLGRLTSVRLEVINESFENKELDNLTIDSMETNSSTFRESDLFHGNGSDSSDQDSDVISFTPSELEGNDLVESIGECELDRAATVIAQSVEAALSTPYPSVDKPTTNRKDRMSTTKTTPESTKSDREERLSKMLAASKKEASNIASTDNRGLASPLRSFSGESNESEAPENGSRLSGGSSVADAYHSAGLKSFENVVNVAKSSTNNSDAPIDSLSSNSIGSGGEQVSLLYSAISDDGQFSLKEVASSASQISQDKVWIKTVDKSITSDLHNQGEYEHTEKSSVASLSSTPHRSIELAQSGLDYEVQKVSTSHSSWDEDKSINEESDVDKMHMPEEYEASSIASELDCDGESEIKSELDCDGESEIKSELDCDGESEIQTTSLLSDGAEYLSNSFDSNQSLQSQCEAQAKEVQETYTFHSTESNLCRPAPEHSWANEESKVLSDLSSSYESKSHCLENESIVTPGPSVSDELTSDEHQQAPVDATKVSNGTDRLEAAKEDEDKRSVEPDNVRNSVINVSGGSEVDVTSHRDLSTYESPIGKNAEVDSPSGAEGASTCRCSPILGAGAHSTRKDLSSRATKRNEAQTCLLCRSIGVQTTTPFTEYTIEVRSYQPSVSYESGEEDGLGQEDNGSRCGIKNDPKKVTVTQAKTIPKAGLEKTAARKAPKSRTTGGVRSSQQPHGSKDASEDRIHHTTRVEISGQEQAPFPQELMETFSNEVESSGITKFWFLW